MNLLSPHAVDVHAQSLREEKEGKQPSFKVKRSYSPGGAIPWKVGSSYRTLEELDLLQTPGERGGTEPVLPGGSVIHVLEVTTKECEDLGPCPFARVSVEEGSQKGSQGWLQCSAKDGHDLVDTRDQLEATKELKRVAKSKPRPISELDTALECVAAQLRQSQGGTPAPLPLSAEEPGAE